MYRMILYRGSEIHIVQTLGRICFAVVEPLRWRLPDSHVEMAHCASLPDEPERRSSRMRIIGLPQSTGTKVISTELTCTLPRAFPTAPKARVLLYKSINGRSMRSALDLRPLPTS
ncbi:hypothetical protein HDG35_005325 [Paraburkholderia sp. JPY681]|uniref:Uncharacterized protein n=1 Tax=Paraburkholderia atlantica TaxID=2654982 RepID=D5WBM5_PARAM|nr:hypothetical protein BC1002_2347 [Paraburkholderia atlantica]MBB5509039.1 hypothetical protein [Paraburkholderia atlantica]